MHRGSRLLFRATKGRLMTIDPHIAISWTPAVPLTDTGAGENHNAAAGERQQGTEFLGRMIILWENLDHSCKCLQSSTCFDFWNGFALLLAGPLLLWFSWRNTFERVIEIIMHEINDKYIQGSLQRTIINHHSWENSTGNWHQLRLLN